MTTKLRNIGVIGGTFDPIHLGHLVIAERAREQFELDCVLFIPAAQPPHKLAAQVSAAEHRYLMTVLALQSHPCFFASDIELRRSGPSYTVDTLQQLKQQYGTDCELFFISGADAIRDLPTWREPQRLLELCQFIAASRPGCRALDEAIAGFGEAGRRRIHTLAMPELDIAATDLRERIKHGRSIRYLVPDAVMQYIEKEGLYR